MPAPIITTRTMPSGWKEVKVRGISVSRRWMLVAENRFCADTVSPVIGCTALSPASEATTEAPITIAIRIRKMVTGSGSLLPARSTALRMELPMLMRTPPDCQLAAD